MSIALRAVSTSTTATGSIPTGTTTGDVMIAIAVNDDNAGVPVTPSGWTSATSGSGTFTGMNIAYRVWQSGDLGPTFNTATAVVVMSYSGCDTADPVGAAANQPHGSQNTTIVIPELTLTETDGTSWVAAGYIHRTGTELTPVGVTERSDFTDGNPVVGSADTAGGVVSFNQKNVTVTGSNAHWRAGAVELLATPTSDNGIRNSLTYELNRLAGTLNAFDVPELAATEAANVWAGTTGLALQGALNAKAGNTGLAQGAVQGVLNQLAGTTGLGEWEAAGRIVA